MTIKWLPDAYQLREAYPVDGLFKAFIFFINHSATHASDFFINAI